MGPSDAGPGERPTRSAATKAALTIRIDAQESNEDGDSIDRTRDSSYNAFAEIMSGSRRSKSIKTAAATTPGSKPSRTTKRPSFSSPSNTSTTASMAQSSNNEIFDTAATLNLVPDLEDLVTDAARVRVSGRHARSYHRFLTQKARKQVHDDLLAWYDAHHRKLPWRRDPEAEINDDNEKPGQRAYEVWVSEIMCQQTQVATVIPYYNTWMAKWPTIADLAAADIEDVNKVWTGLGYYSRASRLHTGAQKVLKQFNGILPSDPAVLEKEVPGIGRYTAGAIVSHAYNVPAELVDGNVIRVLSRLRAIGGDVKSPKVIDLHWVIAKELVHQNRPGCFNQALMELGAMTVDARRSRKEAIGAAQKREVRDAGEFDDADECTLCLPETEVDGKDQGLVTQYPRKAAKKAPRDEECAVCILERTRNDPKTGESISEFLLVKRPDKGLLAGMWEFPTVEQEQLRADIQMSSVSSTGLSTYKERSSSSLKYLTETLGQDWISRSKDLQLRDIGSVQHLFSHIRKVYHVEWVLVRNTTDQNCAVKITTKGRQPEMVWLTADELATAAIPTGINKTFQLLQKFKTGLDKDSAVNTGNGKRKKTVSCDGGSSKDLKKVKKEDGLSDISKFFRKASK
ncbi:hypothetical protein BGX28_007890 [Mortierella sp. GBA30]|nr:hypothetical protein BGX28_007890 [Mortierella sp. GBA30]